MIAEIVGVKADLEMAFGNSLRIGPVEVIDAQKGYRLRLGSTDDAPFLSPFYPHPETGKTSVPLKKGQIVGVMNPSGDPRQGLVFRAGYSDGDPAVFQRHCRGQGCAVCSGWRAGAGNWRQDSGNRLSSQRC